MTLTGPLTTVLLREGIMENLAAIVAEAEQNIAATDDLRTLEELRVAYLGKKGRLTALLKGLGKLPGDQRPAASTR